MHPENVKQLRSKTNKLKFGQFGQILGVPGAQMGPYTQNYCIETFIQET